MDRLAPIALAVTATLGFSFTAPLCAQTNKTEFQQVSQSLGAALDALAAKTGIRLLYSPEAVKNKQAPALTGRLSSEDALTRLLTGTDLTWTRSVDGAYAVKPAPTEKATELSPIEIRSDGEHRTAYHRPIASTATKTDTPLMETPFTVQVLPQQVLTDLGQQQNLGGAMRLLGIPSWGFDSYGNSYTYRGFYSATTLWNGFRIEDGGATRQGTVWMDTVDRVELMRGPASILYGQVEPGGMVNVITKLPLEAFRGEARMGVGSWGNRWASVDLTGTLNENKTLLGRVVIADQKSGSYFSHSHDYHSTGIAPQLELRISPDTTLAFEGQYRNVDTETWHNSWYFVDPATGQTVSAPRKDSRLPDNYARYEQNRSLLRLDHRFNNDWSMSWKVLNDMTRKPHFYQQSADNADFTSLAPGVLNVGLTTLYQASRTATRATTLDVLGHFTTGTLKHTLLLGADIYDQNFQSKDGGDSSATTNIYAPISLRTTDGNLSTQDRRKYSFYAQDQIELPSHWFVLGGLRYEHIREDYSDVTGVSPTIEKNVVTPRLGLLWRPQPWISAYYSYSENQGQSQGLEGPGKPLKPEFSKQHEAGVKTEWLDGRLSATASVFQLTKENIAAANPANPLYVIGVGKVESRGYELNVQGAVTDNLKLTANYSYAKPLVKVGGGGTGANGNWATTIATGELLMHVPLRNFSLWASYRMPWAPEWTVGGGASWRSKETPANYSTNVYTGQLVSADAYWLASMFARYETRVAGYKTQFQLNVDNLFNKEYSSYTDCIGGYGLNSCFHIFGDPRSAQLEMRVEF
ncbi:MAG: TonB-dependent siderophore receptor [Deltaproteobacteria bacterium]|nr:TonB-dependent siderophore receptor [Deltaproteobacteria bacterium]